MRQAEGAAPARRPWRTWAALPGQFWRLALTVALFNAGVSVYLFLYSLFLLDQGMREQRIGLLVSAMTLGSITSTLAIPGLARRWGLRRILVLTLLLLGGALALRTLVVWFPAQMFFAFVSGSILSGWVVCLSPAVAGVVQENQRPLAFSILYSIAVATGSIGGVVGAQLPALWMRIVSAPLEAKRLTLLSACALAALAAWPVAGIRLPWRGAEAAARRPLSRFLQRFLLANGCWGAAIGIFNPFTAVYFTTHLHVSLPRLGLFFAVVQALQAVAVLCAPALLRRAGLVSGIVILQVATAMSVGLLSSSHSVGAAMLFYCGCMAAQHMTEPGMQSLLMGRVAEGERSRAAGLAFLVTSLAQATAASAGGFAFGRFSYPTALAGVAAAILVSAGVFAVLCGIRGRDQPSILTQDLAGDVAASPLA